MIGQQVHDRLITDFATLTFQGGGLVSNAVKKFYAAGSMEPQNCLIIPDSNTEDVSGGSAGNTQTTREYSFRAIAVENIEATDSDNAGSIKYQRLLNTQDAWLDYLQKEPSNLNSWGATNSIAIYKIRVKQVRWDTLQTEGGYSAILDVLFSVYLNVIPQNL